MTATEFLAKDLPLLTTVVEEAPDDLPTLTEVVVEETSPLRSSMETAAPLGDELSSLMDAITAEPAGTPEAGIVESSVQPPALSEADMQRLILQLDAHLESVFAQKLGHRLEQLQRLAVDQAIRELKAELPQMLRDALHAPDTGR